MKTKYDHLELEAFFRTTGLTESEIPSLKPYLRRRDAYNIWFQNVSAEPIDNGTLYEGDFVTQFRTLTQSGDVVITGRGERGLIVKGLASLFGLTETVPNGVFKPDNPAAPVHFKVAKLKKE